MNFGAIIVAAGRGVRMGSGLPKQYLKVMNRPVILYTIDKFINLSDFFKKIILVAPPGGAMHCRDVVLLEQNCSKYLENKLVIVEGGKQRQDSVWNGLQHLDEDIDVVCIHDGVRPLVSSALIKSASLETDKWGALVTAIPLKDTLKENDEAGFVKKTLSRERLYLIQTPQCFRMDIILNSYDRAFQDKFYGTDDASLVERVGYPVRIIPGEPSNLKVTTPEDLIIMEMILKREKQE